MNALKIVKVMIQLSVGLIASMCGATAPHDSTSPAYASEIASTLAAAGSNRDELAKALKLVAPEQSQAMQFLIAHMPESDAKSVDAHLLLENVTWAYKARAAFPWARAVPEAIFLNDVLPYASLNERRDNWREDFFNRFSKHVANAQTQEQALKAINQHIVEELKVVYSIQRKKAEQSPYESMELGLASCTGLSILLNNAFRAVGIPSRLAGTAAWTTKRGNHTWVEVWTTANQQWRFTEYYPDANGLDHGWLLADAARANPESFIHSIYASSWKPTGLHFPLVWDMENHKVPAENVTKRYIKLGSGEIGDDVCELRIQWTRDGERFAVPVSVTQGDVKLAEGTSPKPTDDMNRYFTVQVRKGQIYQVMWKDPKSGEMMRKSFETPKNQSWWLMELNNG